MTHSERLALLSFMDKAGFTQHECNNERLRCAALKLMIGFRDVRFCKDTEIEFGGRGPFLDDKKPQSTYRDDGLGDCMGYSDDPCGPSSF